MRSNKLSTKKRTKAKHAISTPPTPTTPTFSTPPTHRTAHFTRKTLRTSTPVTVVESPNYNSNEHFYNCHFGSKPPGRGAAPRIIPEYIFDIPPDYFTN